MFIKVETDVETPYPYYHRINVRLIAEFYPDVDDQDRCYIIKLDGELIPVLESAESVDRKIDNAQKPVLWKN